MIKGNTEYTINTAESPAGTYTATITGSVPKDIYDCLLYDSLLADPVGSCRAYWNGTDDIIEVNDLDERLTAVEDQLEQQTPPASGSVETVTAYKYLLKPDATPDTTSTFHYQMITPLSEGEWNDTIIDTQPNNAGLISITLAHGVYEYWRNQEQKRTIRIDEDTADPYQIQ